MNRINLTSLFLFLFTILCSQNSDSIYYALRTVKNDSVKTVIVLTNIVEPLKAKGDFREAEKELTKASQFINNNDNIYFVSVVWRNQVHMVFMIFPFVLKWTVRTF